MAPDWPDGLQCEHGERRVKSAVSLRYDGARGVEAVVRQFTRAALEPERIPPIGHDELTLDLLPTLVEHLVKRAAHIAYRQLMVSAQISVELADELAARRAASPVDRVVRLTADSAIDVGVVAADAARLAAARRGPKRRAFVTELIKRLLSWLHNVLAWSKRQGEDRRLLLVAHREHALLTECLVDATWAIEDDVHFNDGLIQFGQGLIRACRIQALATVGNSEACAERRAALELLGHWIADRSTLGGTLDRIEAWSRTPEFAAVHPTRAAADTAVRQAMRRSFGSMLDRQAVALCSRWVEERLTPAVLPDREARRLLERAADELDLLNWANLTGDRWTRIPSWNLDSPDPRPPAGFAGAELASGLHVDVHHNGLGLEAGEPAGIVCTAWRTAWKLTASGDSSRQVEAHRVTRLGHDILAQHVNKVLGTPRHIDGPAERFQGFTTTWPMPTYTLVLESTVRPAGSEATSITTATWSRNPD